MNRLETKKLNIAGRRRVYLMRHGHVDYFNPEMADPRRVPLTQEGRRQAQAARDALAHIPFDVAVYSGLPRTCETAEIVLSAHQRPPALEIEEGFEELKSGWVKAASREEFAARIAFSFDDADAPGARFLPDGEMFSEAEARIRSAFETLLTKRAWRSALIVAHEGVNRISLGWACGGGLSTIAAFEQDLCCVNVIDFDVTPLSEGFRVERAVLKAMNVTPYDYVKHGLPRTSLEHLFDVDFGAARPAAKV